MTNIFIQRFQMQHKGGGGGRFKTKKMLTTDYMKRNSG